MTDLLSSTARIRATGKAAGVRLLSFGIPAYRSAAGRATCPLAGDCSAYCYGLRGSYSWPTVSNKYEDRYMATRADDFVDRLSDEIGRRRPDLIRVHDVGDYYSPAYLDRWIQIADRHPSVRFYSYTTSIRIVKAATIPSNFSICYSMASKEAHLIQPTDRHVRIFDTVEDLDRAGYTNASDNDLLSTRWFNDDHRIGLVWNSPRDAKKAAIARSART